MAQHQEDEQLVMDHVSLLASHDGSIKDNTRRIVIVEKKQDNVRERLPVIEKMAAGNHSIIQSIIMKQDEMMDTLLEVRSDLGNGLTVRVINAVKEETAKLYRNITIITVVVGTLVGLANVGRILGWFG